jgi:amino acid adenylation domain-containing protein
MEPNASCEASNGSPANGRAGHTGPAALVGLSVAEKRELLKSLLSLGNATTPQPLSFGQQSLWVVHQLAPSSSAYNFLYAARITSELDESALGRAFQALAERHPALRSTFHLDDGKPVQRIQPHMPLAVAMVEASGWSQDELICHMRAEADRPFDLERGPALRISLYRLGPGRHALLLVVHHIIADLWSMDVLVEELRQIYLAERSGSAASLPAPTAQFTDYIRWQIANVYGPRGHKAWEYWRQELAGTLPVLHLPTDRPRPSVQTYRGDAYNWPLDDQAVVNIRRLARRHGTTPFVALLSAFEVLLHRYTGQGDFFVGTATAERDRPEWERLVGYFINQLALRAHLDSGTTFNRLLEETRDRFHQALAHQDYPFGLIVKRLQPRRDPSHTPVFQVMFIWDKARDPNGGQGREAKRETEAGGTLEQPLALETLLMEQRGAPFDLTFIIFETGDRLTASFRYNTDLFDTATITRMAEHFNHLLDTLLKQSDLPLAEMSLLTASERRRLDEWNRTERPYPHDVCFHQLIEQQAAQTPDAWAVVQEGRRLTYDDLNARANRLARRLYELGVGPGRNVGLALPRSPEAVVAILASWKAGAAYIPLDPAYPARRLAAMIEDARPAVILAGASLPDLAGDVASPILRWIDLERELDAFPGHNLDLPCSSEHVAYIIYTSGSSGLPKGTVLRHCGLCNMSEAQVEVFGTAPHDRVLQFASLSFDASVFEMAMALRVGACLMPATAKAALPGEDLLRLLRAERVTNATLPPSALALLPPTELPELRTLIVAGEACPAELVSAWGRGRRFFNAYGPTEATVWSTVAACTPDGRPPTIGRPVPNTRAYVLDDYLQPVPTGVPGELYVAGPGLALCYLNQPGLTAERFVPDPFRPTDDGIMYRTGDLVRQGADGSLEFLGRRDHQVKLHGFRIETEEVQETLRQHPAVGDAVVLALPADASRPARLVAYLVPRVPDASLDLAEVRGFLRHRLPHFMLPAAMTALAKLPLTANGKVDRAALPDLRTDRGGATRDFAAPRSPLEEHLAGLWARVLGADRVGIHDNFFDLGGASIQTLELAALAKEAGIAISADMLFQHQTVAELAAACAHAQPAAPSANGKGHAPRAIDVALPSARAAANGHVPDVCPELDRPTPRTATGGAMVIESLGVYLPPRVVSTEEVVAGCTRPLNFPLERMTGIRTRRMAGDTEFSLDLAVKAIDACLARSAYHPDAIDLLICSNISRYDGPNRFAFEPSTAARLQQRCGFQRALAFDVANACAGTFTALKIVQTMLRLGLIRRAMVVSGEYITHLTRTAQMEIESFLDSRIACLTLGDSGLAMILESAPGDRVGFHDLELYTLGKYHSLCVARASDRPHLGAIMCTDPVTSAAVTIKQAVGHALEVLRRRGWTPEHVQSLILHQTSQTTIDGAMHEVNRAVGRTVCTTDNTIRNLAERGNTATTTHFVALHDRLIQRSVAPGNRIFFGISGSGQTVGSALYTMDDLPLRWQQAPVKKDVAIPDRRTLRLPRRICLESIGLTGEVPAARRDSLNLLRTAGTACLERSRYAADDIELVVHAGVYRSEYLMEPALAAIAAGELDMNADDARPGPRRTLAFDLANGGVGPLNACLVAGQMIAAGDIHTAMVLASEVENNARAWPENLLGIEETASAFLLEASSGNEGFSAFRFHSFGQYLEALSVHTVARGPALALAVQKSPDLDRLYVECLAKAVNEFLSEEGITRQDIGLVLPPLRSPDFVRRLAAALKMPAERFVLPPENVADYFTSSLAQGFARARAEGRCPPGTVALVLAVGAGIETGCALYHF